MRKFPLLLLILTVLLVWPQNLCAEDALSVLGKDFVFPQKVAGLPERLSEVKGLEIHHFTTSDHVNLAYWEAGSGKPLIFVPAWSANGANYINLLYLLSQHYHVYVLDQRNHGLSQKVEYGNRIYRLAMDLREFREAIDQPHAYYCGWSMGVSVLYGYLDLFGSEGIDKLILIDEPPSILSRPEMSAEERLKAGSLTDRVENLGAVMSAHTGNSLMDRYNAMDSPAYANSEAFARALVPVDPVAVNRVMYDHANLDWRDVIARKIQVPTAIFTGDYSANEPSQRWMQSVIPGAKLFVYSKAEQGDHFLAFKKPFKFVADLRSFLDAPQAHSADQESGGIVRKELLRTTQAWNGDSYAPIVNPKPEGVVVEMRLPAHYTLEWHQHPSPNFAYLLSGDITVEDKAGHQKHFHTGEVIPETVGVTHRGKTGDGETRLIVFYLSTVGLPLAVAEK